MDIATRLAGNAAGPLGFIALGWLLQQLCESRKQRAAGAGLEGLGILGLIQSFAEQTWEAVKDLTNTGIDALQGLIDGALAQIESVLRGLGLGLIADFFSRVRGVLGSLFDASKGILPAAVVLIVIYFVARRYFLR